MRIEDLDPDRSRPEYAWASTEDLRWLGIHWQEGPEIGGPFSPYVQSRRHSIYLAAWRKLLAGGFIYSCQCSRKDLASALIAPHEDSSSQRMLAEQELSDDEPVYPGTCRPTPTDGGRMDPFAERAEEAPDGRNWRFRVPDGEMIEFTDLNLGQQRFVAGVDFGDFLVWRRDGVPSYQLACVADDAAMEITEVVRGADLLKSTARQILLNRALGFLNPAWYHCRLVLDQTGRRLAKRYDALSIRVLRERGLTPAEVLSTDLPAQLS
jgi:glutamyl/glutaminyl-tRNA synthetase